MKRKEGSLPFSDRTVLSIMQKGGDRRVCEVVRCFNIIQELGGYRGCAEGTTMYSKVEGLVIVEEGQGGLR